MVALKVILSLAFSAGIPVADECKLRVLAIVTATSRPATVIRAERMDNALCLEGFATLRVLALPVHLACLLI